MKFQPLSKISRKSTIVLTSLLAFSTFGIAQAYQQVNLDSDIAGLAPTTDANLVNPWGLIASPTGPWWVSDNNAGVSTLYNGNDGSIIPLVVNIPPVLSGKGTGTPTGIVFSAGSGFHFNNNGTDSPAVFTFVGEDGIISAWPGTGDAILVIDNSGNPNPAHGAVYKGATIAQMNSGGPSFLYVTNFRAGRIEVYDSNFHPVNLDSAENRGEQAFTDREIPRGFAPFNVQEVNGSLYVTYAQQNASQHDDTDFPGRGYVDKFSAKGKLLSRLEHGPWLNAPWGVALAAANFGFYSNHLLIGNAGSGQIAVYDADSGRFDGLLRDANGHALENDRLWALRFGNDHAAGPSSWLFFTAGISGEAHGLFGFFVPADNSGPENGGKGR
ncbi:MAG: TIGR03118 family protein [Acidobacteriaceae bacterium]